MLKALTSCLINVAGQLKCCHTWAMSPSTWDEYCVAQTRWRVTNDSCNWTLVDTCVCTLNWPVIVTLTFLMTLQCKCLYLTLYIWLLVAPASPGTTRSCRAITNWCVYYIIYTYCALRPVTILYSQVTGEPLVIPWRNHKINERHVFFISLPFISHKWWVTWILTLVLSWMRLFPRLLILWSICWWVCDLPLEGHRGCIICSALQGCLSSILSSWSSSWLVGN